MWFTLRTHVNSDHTAQARGSRLGAEGLCPGQRGAEQEPSRHGPRPPSSPGPGGQLPRTASLDPYWPPDGPDQVVGWHVTSYLASLPVVLIPAFLMMSRSLPSVPICFGLVYSGRFTEHVLDVKPCARAQGCR